MTDQQTNPSQTGCLLAFSVASAFLSVMIGLLAVAMWRAALAPGAGAGILFTGAGAVLGILGMLGTAVLSAAGFVAMSRARSGQGR